MCLPLSVFSLSTLTRGFWFALAQLSADPVGSGFYLAEKRVVY